MTATRAFGFSTKTPEELSIDTQGTVYAKWIVDKFHTEQVLFSHIYFPTNGAQDAKKSPFC